MSEMTTIGAEVEQQMANLPAVVAHEAIVARDEISVEEAAAQKAKILELMKLVMQEGIHYGKIKGIAKPTLLKPGAEAINVALRLAPDYDSTETYDGDHLTVKAKCRLSHITSGLFIAAGEGLCSSREAKYAYRQGKRTCPDCGADAIVKSNRKNAFFCIRDEGGCGHRFAFKTEQAEGIEAQDTSRVPNPDLPDTWNTVLKMADKRALVAAVLNGTAASDVFTQDAEDQPQTTTEPEPQARRQERPPPVNVPKSWEEIEHLVRGADNPEEAWALFRAFIRAATYHLFGEVETESLDKQQRDTLWQKAAGATVWLVENTEHEGPFRFYDESWQRRAWAAVLDGAVLPIPDYQPPEPEGEVDPETERLAREAFTDPPGQSPDSGTP